MSRNLERVAKALTVLTYDEMIELARCIEQSTQGCLEDCDTDELTDTFFADMLSVWANDKIEGDEE